MKVSRLGPIYAAEAKKIIDQTFQALVSLLIHLYTNIVDHCIVLLNDLCYRPFHIKLCDSLSNNKRSHKYIYVLKGPKLLNQSQGKS